ncbi:hypothetical protein BV20DRAFT_1039657 [Pilatotrama ljubarskyi]|nr:hypothetical protein BV20DRAFT_1039657 [Pilatotrama ljubarskyi]
MAQSLAPVISGILHDLPSLIERTLRHETACQALIAQCSDLAQDIDGAKARIAQEKVAQRLLRAEIAAFLRERGELRSANSSRVIEDSMMVSNASASASVADTEDSIFSTKYSNLDVEESPLGLKAKRKCRLFSEEVQIANFKRRRLTTSNAGSSRSPE